MAKSQAKRKETDNKGKERTLTTDEVKEIKDALILVQDKTKPSLTKILSQQKLLALISMARDIFSSQAMMIETKAPTNVIGDIHGQYTDLLRQFSKNGWPHDTPYLFLGDYVDRGKNQLETIILLICYKILKPNTFFLLRGNHECCTINRIYGFFDETKRRYSERVWCDFQAMFNMMPLTALISGHIFCMHGGLSPAMFKKDTKFTWDILRNIDRPLDPKMDESLVTDILWADPDNKTTGFGDNSRGVSHVFGMDIVHKFCDLVGVDLIARGHQVVNDGFEFMANRLLVTIFGATRYCGEFDNAAVTMIISDDLMVQFKVLKARARDYTIRTFDDDDSAMSKSGKGSDRALRRRKASQKEKEKEKEKRKGSEKEKSKKKERSVDFATD